MKTVLLATTALISLCIYLAAAYPAERKVWLGFVALEVGATAFYVFSRRRRT
jgi:uncharacterized membrane protein YhfC